MEITEQERYWVWLSSIEGLGAVSFYNILSVFLDAKTAFENHRDIPKRLKLTQKQTENLARYANKTYMDRLFALIEKRGAKVLTRLNQNYPQNLAEIDNPPPVLYFKGNIPDASEMSCGMVGSRKPTKYGIETSRALAADIAAHNVTIVSGMARGIDTACHMGALDVKGKTVAVLGCGVDVVYPAENKELYERILESGTVISEFLPGTEPTGKNFPQRNRIIAGLSHVLVAGEGGERSGARITVDYALRQGRDVYTMSCDLKSTMAQLPLYLIESGAPVVKSARDILEDQGWAMGAAFVPRGNQQYGMQMTADQLMVYNILAREGMTADELAAETSIAMKDLNMLLTVMELDEVLSISAGGIFRVNR